MMEEQKMKDWKREVFDKLEPIIPEDCSTPSEYSLGELLDKLRTEEVCYVQ